MKIENTFLSIQIIMNAKKMFVTRMHTASRFLTVYLMVVNVKINMLEVVFNVTKV